MHGAMGSLRTWWQNYFVWHLLLFIKNSLPFK
jgi:hypothetical protein